MAFISRRLFLARTTATLVAVVGGLYPGTTLYAHERKPKVHHVEIRGFNFSPDFIKVRQGDTIVWTNFDIAPHTATAKDNSWDTGEITKGNSVKILVPKEFSSEYFCRFHPNMVASLKLL
ncbi:MAG: hypothetical protein L3J21_04510 [Devosiaceae bacterium]|nr:hypothetical protein [Devosiaceae bacterium]